MTELMTSSPKAKSGYRWIWLVAFGVLLAILGVAGLGATVLRWTSILVFGPLLLVSSVLQLTRAFFLPSGKEHYLHLSAAVLEAIAGFLVMTNPFENILSLAAVIALFLIVSGLLRLAFVVATRSRGRAWIAMTGIVAVLLGMLIWTGWPAGQWWFAVLCIALDLIFHGVSWTVVGLVRRRYHLSASIDRIESLFPQHR